MSSKVGAIMYSIQCKSPRYNFFSGYFLIILFFIFFYAKGKIFVEAHTDSFLIYFLRLWKNKSSMTCLAHTAFLCFYPNSQKRTAVKSKSQLWFLHTKTAPALCECRAGGKAEADAPGATEAVAVLAGGARLHLQHLQCP